MSPDESLYHDLAVARATIEGLREEVRAAAEARTEVERLRKQLGDMQEDRDYWVTTATRLEHQLEQDRPEAPIRYFGIGWD